MTIADINVRIGMLSSLKKDMAGIERDLRRSSQNFARVGNEMSMALSLPLLAFGTKAVQTAAQMESLKLAMRTTFQDAGRSIADADKELEALRKSALAPGLDFEQAVKASIRLQSVGLSAEKAREIVEQLANTISMSGGDPESLERVVRQFVQMSSKGRVLQEDLTVISESMPAISKLMSEAFGTTNAEKLREMGVTADEFIDTITGKMKELPRVTSGLANSITNVGQSIQTFLQQIGDDIVETFDLKTKFEQFGTWLSGVAEKFKNLSAGTKEFILWTGAAVVALGPLFKIYGAILGLGSQLMSLFGSMANALKAMAGMGLEAAKALQAMTMAQRAFVIGAGIAVLVALISTINQFRKANTDAERAQVALNEVTLAAAQSIAAERLEAEKLIGTIKDETATREQKEAALKRLNELGGEYFKGLSIEKSSVTELTAAYDGYIANLLQAAKARAATEKIVQLEKDRLELADQLEKQNARLAGKGKLAQAFLNSAGGAGAINADLEKKIKENEALQKALANTAFGAGPVAATTSGGAGDAPQSFARNVKPTGTGKAKKEAATVASILADLNREYDMAALKGEALGASFDVQAERAGLLQSAITTLLGMGLKPTDEAMLPLIERYKALGMELDMLPQRYSVVLPALLATTTQMTAQAEQVSAAWKELGETLSSSLEVAGQAMIDYANTGGDSLRKLGKEALKAAASVARGALISFVSSVIKDTGIAAGPLGAIIGPAAGAAAGVAFNSILKSLKIPAFADGGVVFGETLGIMGEYAGARTNPEVIAPLDKLQSMLNLSGGGRTSGKQEIVGYRIAGRDLYLMLQDVDRDVRRGAGI